MTKQWASFREVQAVARSRAMALGIPVEVRRFGTGWWLPTYAADRNDIPDDPDRAAAIEEYHAAVSRNYVAPAPDDAATTGLSPVLGETLMDGYSLMTADDRSEINDAVDGAFLDSC